MFNDGIGAKVRGIPELKAALHAIPAKLRRQALRNALAAGARVVRDAARRVAPVLAARTPFRTPGLVRKAISVRTSKQARRNGDVGVFVNVRPAAGARYRTVRGAFGSRTRVQTRASQRGARSPRDPFYWRFLEFGTRHMRAFGFLRAGARQLGQALQVFVSKIGPQIQRLNGGKGVQL